MEKDDDEATPEEAAVIKTAGEDSARAYVVGELREHGEHPAMEADRVKIVPPSQTPTVRLADARKGVGPRAPDQMELPKPRPAVYLPEGRPLTKLQEFEIDEDFLAELRQARLEAGARRDAEKATQPRGEAVGEGAEAPAAEEVGTVEAPVAAPVSAGAGKRVGRSGVAMGLAIGLAVAAGVIVMVRMGGEGEEKRGRRGARW